MEQPRAQNKTTIIFVAVGSIGLTIHLLADQKFDAVALALVAIALLPWVGHLISSAELPGGWKLEFAKIENSQRRQQEQIEIIRFLLAHFLSQHEIEHLTKLAEVDEFIVREDESKDFFLSELRRLLSLNLIQLKPDKNLDMLYPRGDSASEVNDYLEVTEAGKKYLELRQSYESQSAGR